MTLSLLVLADVQPLRPPVHGLGSAKPKWHFVPAQIYPILGHFQASCNDTVHSSRRVHAWGLYLASLKGKAVGMSKIQHSRQEQTYTSKGNRNVSLEAGRKETNKDGQVGKQLTTRLPASNFYAISSRTTGKIKSASYASLL